LTPIFFDFQPNMTPSCTHVGPYNHLFCPSFSDHLSNSISDLILDQFRTPNRPQNQSKIDQKFLPKSSYKQILFQLHLRSNSGDNLMFKQNGRCSKIVPKPDVFCMFFNHPLMPTKANTRHATHAKIIKKHVQNQ